jgi:hypothetical protein
MLKRPRLYFRMCPLIRESALFDWIGLQVIDSRAEQGYNWEEQGPAMWRRPRIGTLVWTPTNLRAQKVANNSELWRGGEEHPGIPVSTSLRLLNIL